MINITTNKEIYITVNNIFILIKYNQLNNIN